MRPVEHLTHFLLAKPARVFKLPVVKGKLAAESLGDTADHQRAREWPGLRGEVIDASDANSNLFRHLAADGVFDRLPRFHESGEAGIHLRRETRLTAEQTLVAIDDEHNDGGIRARKMLGAAGVASAPPASAKNARRRAAVRTKAVPRMPE